MQIQNIGVSLHQQTITLKQNAMNASEIHRLASELTEKEINNVLGAWDRQGETKKTKLYNTLLRLGDNKALAMATVILEGNTKEESPIYKQAYEL